MEPSPTDPLVANGNTRTVWLLAAGVGLMLCACLGAAGVLAYLLMQRTGGAASLAATLVPRATLAAPTRTPEPWPLVLQDDFSTAAYGWERGDLPGRFADGVLGVQDGRYLMDIQSHEGVLWWSLADPDRTAADADLEVQAEKLDDTAGDYGLVLRWDQSNYYYYQVHPSDQTYSLQVYYLEKWITLLDWTNSDAILDNGPNRLAARAEGTRFALYVNGQFLQAVDDDHIARGAMGVAVQVYNANERGRFAFDDFVWRSPEGQVEQKATATP